MADRDGVVPPRLYLLSAEIMSQLGGGFRQQRWCEYFLQRGHSIRILCASGAMSLRQTDVASVDELRRLRAQWTSSSPPRGGVRTGAAARLARFLKHLLLVDLILPSNLKLYFRLSRDVAQAPGRVVILCSSPPFALAVVAGLVKARYRDKVVFALDMRDLWSLHSALPGPAAHKRWIERRVLSAADVITTVSVGLASRFGQAFGATARVVYNVATHVIAQPGAGDALDWTTVSPLLNAASRKLVYTGSAPDGYYDLDTLFGAVADLAADLPDASRRLQFVFVGAGEQFAASARARGIADDLIVVLPQMSHADVARIQSAADLFLFLGYTAHDNQGQVSIKLFEYFRRRRPVLPLFIRSGSDVDYLITLYCGSCPHLLTRQEVVSSLKVIATRQDTDLPIAINDKADEQLLADYVKATDDILGLFEPQGGQDDAPLVQERRQ